MSQIMQKAWDDFANKVMPADAPPIQLKECRRAFYAGAWAFINDLKAALDPSHEPTDGDLATFMASIKELEDFAEAVRRGEA